MSFATANSGRLGRQSLPWCALICLSLAFAPVVEASESSLPAAATAPLASSARSRSVVVMISVQGAATGDDTEMLCRTTEDRTSSDMLLLKANTVSDVLPALCDSTWLSVPVPYTRSTRFSNQ